MLIAAGKRGKVQCYQVGRGFPGVLPGSLLPGQLPPLPHLYVLAWFEWELCVGQRCLRTVRRLLDQGPSYFRGWGALMFDDHTR